MPGLDKQRVVGKDDDELDELVCGICHDIFNEPVVTQCCRQTYCKVCINQWLTNRNTCPNDRQELNINMLLQPPRFVINILSKLKVKCENYLNGCQIILALEQMQEHLKICTPCSVCRGLTKVVKANEQEIALLKSQIKTKDNLITTLLANERRNNCQDCSSAQITNSLQNIDLDQEQVNLPRDKLAKFLGKWRLQYSNNLENFLKQIGIEQGWNYPSRTTIIKSSSRFELIKDGEYYVFLLNNMLIKHKLDVECEEKRFGKTITSLITFDGTKLIQVEKHSGMLVICLREIIGDALTVTSIANGIKCVLVYKHCISEQPRAKLF